MSNSKDKSGEARKQGHNASVYKDKFGRTVYGTKASEEPEENEDNYVYSGTVGGYKKELAYEAGLEKLLDNPSVQNFLQNTGVIDDDGNILEQNIKQGDFIFESDQPADLKSKIEAKKRDLMEDADSILDEFQPKKAIHAQEEQEFEQFADQIKSGEVVVVTDQPQQKVSAQRANFCSQCGAKFGISDNFCAQCGAKRT